MKNEIIKYHEHFPIHIVSFLKDNSQIFMNMSWTFLNQNERPLCFIKAIKSQNALTDTSLNEKIYFTTLIVSSTLTMFMFIVKFNFYILSIIQNN